ncbi:MAG: hypothetical protein ACTSW1_07880, partial [Candidatus Hodarchaeales archaeon]
CMSRHFQYVPNKTSSLCLRSLYCFTLFLLEKAYVQYLGLDEYVEISSSDGLGIFIYLSLYKIYIISNFLPLRKI